MENPNLTFVTPTLLAGDRSLVDVIAHELAHSWTGERREENCVNRPCPSPYHSALPMLIWLLHLVTLSFAGNLVTNRTWRDFWLNEGWTMMVQVRIIRL